MSDLLDLLGDEWALPEAPEPPAPRWSCKCPDREDVTHGCRESGRTPSRWSDVLGGYVDGMGRPVGCSYCFSCVSTGRTSLRDPWTDALVEWAGAPCLYCDGTGYDHHRWDCDGNHGHLQPWPRLERIEHFGVTWDGRTFVAGEVLT